MARNCFLKGYGKCSGKISREHYLSEVVLSLLHADGDFRMGGLSWQPKGTLQKIGIGSLTARVLCEGHNSRLSRLDKVGGRLFGTLCAMDSRPDSLPPLLAFEGPNVERWFLKILCGLAAAGQIEAHEVPEEWKKILTGEEWPDGWGMYVAYDASEKVLPREIAVETLLHAVTRQILAAKFRIAGVGFFLLFGRPPPASPFGIRRARGIIFRLPDQERRVEFLWPFPVDECVLYTAVGPNDGTPPQWAEWKD